MHFWNTLFTTKINSSWKIEMRNRRMFAADGKRIGENRKVMMSDKSFKRLNTLLSCSMVFPNCSINIEKIISFWDAVWCKSDNRTIADGWWALKTGPRDKLLRRLKWDIAMILSDISLSATSFKVYGTTPYDIMCMMSKGICLKMSK